MLMLLMRLYQWFEYVSIANPELDPLLSTIVAPGFHKSSCHEYDILGYLLYYPVN
jgi:hypothetical protein